MISTDESVILANCSDVAPEEAPAIVSALERELSASNEPGIGLAASQIGLLKRAFIVRTESKALDFINPKIISLSEPLIFREEGCLSYPGKKVRTIRYNRTTISDMTFPSGRSLTGLEAIVAQHEYQHTVGQNMFRNELSNTRDGDVCLCTSGKLFKNCCKKELIRNMRVL